MQRLVRARRDEGRPVVMGPDGEFSALVFSLLRAIGRYDMSGAPEDPEHLVAGSLGAGALEMELERDDRRREIAQMLLAPIMREGLNSLGAALQALSPEEGERLRTLMAGDTLWELFDIGGDPGAPWSP